MSDLTKKTQYSSLSLVSFSIPFSSLFFLPLSFSVCVCVCVERGENVLCGASRCANVGGEGIPGIWGSCNLFGDGRKVFSPIIQSEIHAPRVDGLLSIV